VYEGLGALVLSLIGGRELAFGFNMRARSAGAPAAWLRLRGRGRLCVFLKCIQPRFMFAQNCILLKPNWRFEIREHKPNFVGQQ